MATKNELLQFTIVNNTTDCNINVPFLSQDSPIINAKKKYTWNITGLNLGCGCWSIVINSQTYQVYYTGGLVGLLNGLNNLGFSFFCSTTSGGNLFLYTLDDYNVYGNVESCFCTTTSTTTTTTTPTPTTSTTTTTTTPTPTTSTTTTTTTAIFNGIVNYGSNQYDACNNPTGTINVTGNASTFCTSTIFTSAGFTSFANGNYLLSFGGNSVNINISGAPTTTATMFGGGCSACPTPTTTSTTSTTTTAAPFSGSVAYSGNDATVCYTPVATFTMTGNASTFCTSTIFTSATWNGIASGAYFIAFGGNILPVNHIVGQNTATTSGTCTTCPITTTTTSTTTSTTTAAPLFTWVGTVSNYASSALACANALSIRSFFSTLSGGLVNGVTKFYDDLAGTIPTNGGSLWYAMHRVTEPTTFYAVQIDSTGTLIANTLC